MFFMPKYGIPKWQGIAIRKIKRIENAKNENKIVHEKACEYDRNRKNPGCQKQPQETVA